MDAHTLELDVAVARRSLVVELALGVGGETVVLVGPSGAGKTTVLRAVAGLARPERGRIVVSGRTLFDSARRVDVAPEERRVGYVFQEYALFPHLSVRDNVAYGGRRRVGELLERFGIAHLSAARPGELSGGERQRVALARALAREPEVLLLDEPLAALDSHTRAVVRGELRSLLRELALPTLVVTHDFTDAAALADRIGVVSGGRLLQSGTANDLVARPAGAFVASFTGANLLGGTARPGGNGLTAVDLDGGGTVYSTDDAAGPVAVVVQPWDVALALGPPDDSALNHLRAPVESVFPLGNRVRVQVGPLVAEVTAASAERLGVRVGGQAVASFKATAARLVPR